MKRRLAGAAAGAVAGYALLVEPRRLVVRHHRFALPHWPAELDGFRVGVLSDFHAGAPHAGAGAMEKWVERMNAEHPDLVLLGGDYTDAHPLFGGRMSPDRIAAQLDAAARAARGGRRARQPRLEALRRARCGWR